MGVYMKTKILVLLLFASFLNAHGQEEGFLRSVTVPISGDSEEAFGEVEIWQGNSSQEELDRLAKLMAKRKDYTLFINALHRTLQEDLKEIHRISVGLPIDVRFNIDSRTSNLKLSVKVYSLGNEELAQEEYWWFDWQNLDIGGILPTRIASVLKEVELGKSVLEVMRGHPLFTHREEISSTVPIIGVELSNHTGEPSFVGVEILNSDRIRQQELRQVALMMVQSHEYKANTHALHRALTTTLGELDWGQYRFGMHFNRTTSSNGIVVYILAVAIYSPENERLAHREYTWVNSAKPAINFNTVLPEVVANALEDANVEERALELMGSHPLFALRELRSGSVKTFSLSNDVGNSGIPHFNKIDVLNRTHGGVASKTLREVARLMVLDQGYAGTIDRLILALEELEEQLQQTDISPYFIRAGLGRLDGEKNDGKFGYRLWVTIKEDKDEDNIANLVFTETYDWPINYEESSEQYYLGLDIEARLLVMVAMGLQKIGGFEEVVAKILRDNHPIFNDR